MARTWIDRGEPFSALLHNAQYIVYRWECQGEYHEPDEAEPWRRWRNGDRDMSWIQGWADNISRWSAQGKTWRRVRMLSDPLTNYLRWMIDVTRVNVDAGEDIRWVTALAARDLDLPSYDFYLLDESAVAILHFDDGGVAGAELVDDDRVVKQHQVWRDLVWGVAVPHRQYLAERSR